MVPQRRGRPQRKVPEVKGICSLTLCSPGLTVGFQKRVREGSRRNLHTRLPSKKEESEREVKFGVVPYGRAAESLARPVKQ